MTGESLVGLPERLRARMGEIERIAIRSAHHCDCRDLGCENDEMLEVVARTIQAHREIIRMFEDARRVATSLPPGEFASRSDSAVALVLNVVLMKLGSIYFPESDG